MVVFNQTFSADRQVFFPNNWATGKTELQLYDQWKLTTEYAIYSNILQVIVSAAWILIVGVLFIAILQIKKIQELDDESREKRENRRYLKIKFLVSLGLLSIVCVSVTAFLMFTQEWTRLALLKGMSFWIVAFLAYKIYSRVKPAYLKWKKSKKNNKPYQRVLSEQKQNNGP